MRYGLWEASSTCPAKINPSPPTPLGKWAISRQLNLHQVLKSVKDLFYGLGLYTLSWLSQGFVNGLPIQSVKSNLLVDYHTPPWLDLIKVLFTPKTVLQSIRLSYTCQLFLIHRHDIFYPESVRIFWRSPIISEDLRKCSKDFRRHSEDAAKSSV